jgi:hypothetical protein
MLPPDELWQPDCEAVLPESHKHGASCESEFIKP